MRVLLNQAGHQQFFYNLLLEKYNETNSEVIILKDYKSDKKKFGKFKVVEKEELYILENFDFERISQLVENIEIKLGISLNNIILCDRQYSDYFYNDEIDYLVSSQLTLMKDYYKSRKFLFNLINKIDKLLEETNPDYIITGHGDFFANILITVANYYGIKSYNAFYSKLGEHKRDGGRRFISSNYLYQNILLEAEYNKLTEIKHIPTDFAKKFVNDFKIKPQSINKHVFGKKIKSRMKKVVSSISSFILNKKLLRSGTTFSHIVTNLTIIFKYDKQLHFFTNEKLIKDNERYVYFPLNMSPELVLLCFAPEYVSQLNTIKQLSRYLPFNTTLAIREHPYNIGRRKKIFLDVINRIPNLKIASLLKSQFKFIQNSAAVITINGTTGWEALLLKKPLFKFGATFYDLIPWHNTLTNYAELEKKYNEHLNMIHEISDEEYYAPIYIFIDAEFNTTFSLDQYGVEFFIEKVAKDCTQNIEKYNYWKTIF